MGRIIKRGRLGADGKYKPVKVTAFTRADALDKLRRARRQLDEGRALGKANDSVGTLLTDFYARGLPPPAKSPNTHESYWWAIEGHLVPGLGARRLPGSRSEDKELSADDVDTFLQRKASEGLAKTSIAHLHQVLSRALRWGERRGRVGRNVATLVDTPEGKRRTSKALTVEQARNLLKASTEHRLEALFVLGLCVPSRPGELTGLCWDCVDFDHGIIHFRRALRRNQATKKLELGDLKPKKADAA